MMAYREGVNVDRLIAFTALVCFSKIQQANIGVKKIVKYIDTPNNNGNREKISKLNMNGAFRHIGKKPNKNPFKNFR
jgi:hypothetical protein